LYEKARKNLFGELPLQNIPSKDLIREGARDNKDFQISVGYSFVSSKGGGKKTKRGRYPPCLLLSTRGGRQKAEDGKVMKGLKGSSLRRKMKKVAHGTLENAINILFEE